ncbi:MAG: hypothetical protein ACR2PI_07450 [Hyphomicrobiaceae bacterium]
MRITAVLLIAFLALSGPVAAQAPILQPSADLTPEDVISIQLKALSEAENDRETDSGVARVWAFAHPANRVVTGPLARFKRMLQSAQYRALIGHRSHRMRQVSLSDDKAHFAIKVTSSDGDVFGYSWHLGKVDAGSYKGMWMTTGVALVGKLGRSL